MRILKTLTTTALIAGSTATVALAQPTSPSDNPNQVPTSAAAASSAMPPSPALRAARKHARLMCDSDLTKACPDARPGAGGGLGQCMKQHYQEFSPDCQSALKSLRLARQAQ